MFLCEFSWVGLGILVVIEMGPCFRCISCELHFSSLLDLVLVVVLVGRLVGLLVWVVLFLLVFLGSRGLM